jgi:DNA topoisomerase I
MITLDFLGKDSMRYFNTVEVDKQAFRNLHKFTIGKKKDGELFDLINVIHI